MKKFTKKDKLAMMHDFFVTEAERIIPALNDIYAHWAKGFPELPSDFGTALSMWADFLSDERVLLEKKADAPRSESKAKKAQREENDAIIDYIVSLLKINGGKMCIKEMRAISPDLTPYKSQKLSALLRIAGQRGLVTKVVEKKVTYFSAC